MAKPLTSSVTVDGETVVHTTRRFVSPPENFALLQYHFVEQGDRLDNISNTLPGWTRRSIGKYVMPMELIDQKS